MSFRLFQTGIPVKGNRFVFTQTRSWSDMCGGPCPKKGLVIGVYDTNKVGEYKMTYTGSKVDSMIGGQLSKVIKGTGIRRGNCRVFNNLGSEFYGVAVAGLGPENAGFNGDETLNECKENIRVAAAVGAQALQKMEVTDVCVEGFTNSEAAAEGAQLGVWIYQEYKRNKLPIPKLSLYDDPDQEGWDRGMIKACSQNIARDLEEAPPNVMTPTNFAQTAMKILCPCGVQVDVRNRDWMEEKNMTAMVAASKSSCEPPLFLELSYCGGGEDDKPVIMVAKGTTFDSGALCLRKAKGMDEYRADMAGAAVVVGVMRSLALLQIPVNVSALIPVCENMPGGMAMKPGDVVFGMCSKSIRVKDTSKEGRVLMADALTHACHYKPCLVLSMGTTTEGIRTALGGSSSGVFSNSRVVWKELEKAGAETGDRVWRMPLWEYYSKKITYHPAFDVSNVGAGRGGDPCLGAAFLLQFAPPVDYAHLDITGTGMSSTGLGFPYLRKGLMTGRPTRTLVQFLYQMACPQDQAAEC